MRSQFVVLIASTEAGLWPDCSRSGRTVVDCEKVLPVIEEFTVEVISMFGIGLARPSISTSHPFSIEKNECPDKGAGQIEFGSGFPHDCGRREGLRSTILTVIIRR